MLQLKSLEVDYMKKILSEAPLRPKYKSFRLAGDDVTKEGLK
jgi:hypothetical protein